MIILSRSRLQIERMLQIGSLILALSLGLFCVGGFLFFQFYSWEQEGGRRRESTFVPASSPFSYESIGSGPLALNPHAAYGWVSEIARNLLILAYNSRPDVDQKEISLVLGLKNKKTERELVNGRTLFLEGNPEAEGFAFSDKQQALWIKPLLLDNGGVLVEVGRKLGSLDAPHSEEKGQFVVPPPSQNSKLGANTPFAHALKSARAWGQDQLIQKYGGREFQDLREKFKLEFFKEEGEGYACLVAPGDQLIWKKGEWQVALADERTEGFPVALVKGASAKGIDLSAWDESGYSPLHLHLSLETLSKMMGKIEGMPTSLRQRTATQVSCLLGKKRLILRQGDWVMKTSAGWKILRSKEEIERCLAHRTRGELLIFDRLEKEQGRVVFKGHLFDEMRTQCQSLSLPIEAEKKGRKNPKKRKLPFATKSVFPLWFLSQTMIRDSR